MTGEPLGEFDRVSAFLHLYVEDCEAVYRRALAAGAESITKPADQFYGDRSCEVRDPLGNLWVIATRIENLPSEEIERRAATRTIYRLCEPAGSVLAPPSTRTDVAQDVNRSPAAISDGLPVSVLREEGIATGPIENMLQAIRSGQYTKLDSVLIACNGKLVLDAYFNGFDHDTKHDMRSAFKSVTSALAGIAIDKGVIADPHQLISGFFPDYWPGIEDGQAWKNRITLHHLLTMMSGFDAEESAGIGPDREEDMFRSEDWVAFSLNLPMARKPGTHFSYNSSTTFLIGEIVSRAVGEPLPVFAKANLFLPLGITDYCWTIAPGGCAVAQGNFYIRPRDMVKIGQLFLNHGRWQEKQIISVDWIEESTKEHVRSVVGSGSRIGSDGEKYDAGRDGYGYQWWTRAAGNPSFNHYFASGNGGQKIFVLPNLDMVVVFTGSHYGSYIGHRQATDLFNRYITPAILQGRRKE
jgi:CubicO group peptidase (beta-lactamase class C family)